MVKGGAKNMEELIEKSNQVQRGRLARTALLFSKTPQARSIPTLSNYFGNVLIDDITLLVDFAAHLKIKAAVRLNATSDLPWEAMPVHSKRNIMSIFPQLQFYDYTKWPLDERPGLPDNYYLTFSRSENKDSDLYARQYMASGYNVAVVFST
jgi:hypothetical protein